MPAALHDQARPLKVLNEPRALKVLIVKLSSLGDVLHTMPAVQDIANALPHAQIDWVVERSFAGVVRRCKGINRVIECDLRKWRKSLLSGETRREWRAFKSNLQLEHYDAVVDLQGLSKSAWVAWLAVLAPGGKRHAMANRTEGSSYEAPTRWVAHQAISIKPHIHAVQRAREVCARALGYALPENASLHSKFNPEFKPSFGLLAGVKYDSLVINNVAKKETSEQQAVVVFAHGSSREDKLWPVSHWVSLGQRLNAQGFRVALAHGNAIEEQRSHAIAKQLARQSVQGVQAVQTVVWPRLGLDALTDALAASFGVIGVDSGLSHIAVALDLPHVQIYNFDTAWRTGPLPLTTGSVPRQVSVFALPTPSVDAVWQAWLAVMAVDA